MSDDTQVWVKTMYGAKSKQALVTLQWGDRTPFQFPPTKAREIAMMLLEAAEAAEQDGFVVEFFKDKIGVGEEEVAVILNEFRVWRDKERGKA